MSIKALPARVAHTNSVIYCTATMTLTESAWDWNVLQLLHSITGLDVSHVTTCCFLCTCFHYKYLLCAEQAPLRKYWVC